MLPIFQIEDFPRMEQEKSGYSVYRNVLIKWDEDCDTRILAVIDLLTNEQRASLVIAQEHESCLSLIWNGAVPEEYQIGKRVQLNEDSFLIYDSRKIGTKALDYWKQFKTPEHGQLETQ